MRYIYAIRMGYNIEIGKMLVHNFDILIQPYYTGGVRLVGVIIEIWKKAGATQHNTDVMVKCCHKVNPATLERIQRPRFSQH